MVKLGELMRKTRSVDPRKTPETLFQLFSIPAYDKGSPELIRGEEVGSSKTILQDSDVVLSKIVPHIRRTWVIPSGGNRIGSSEWIVFNDARFDPVFLAEHLKSDIFHRQLLTTVAGVGGSLNRARPAAVADLKIPLPPLNEQKRIAEILGGVADCLIAVQSEIDKVESLVAGVISQFSDDGKMMRLDELAVISGGLSLGSHRKSKPLTSKYLRVANVSWGQVLYEEIKELKCTEKELERTILQDGDIVIVEAHANKFQVGRSATIRNCNEQLVFQNHLFRARPVAGIDSDVLAAMLSSFIVRRQLYQMAKTTSGLNTISISQVRSLQVPIPTGSGQVALNSNLRQLDHLCQLLRQKLALLQELQRSLSARLFDGRL